MANFAAEFPVNPKWSVADVARLACRWITGSPHTAFASDALDTFPNNGELTVSAGVEHVVLAHAKTASGEIGGLRYERTEDGLAWTTSIVSLKTDGQHLLRMEVVCEALTTQVRLPPPKKPYFIKQALTELGGGDDGEVPVTDRPFRLSAGEENVAASLILGTARNSLPIVYVSAGVDDRPMVDPDELARYVGGLAHVVVEPSRSFSYGVKRLTKSRNVFGGTVGVYWPNSDRRNSYFSDDGDSDRASRALAIDIAKDIRVALSNRRQSSDCTWAHLKEAVAKNTYEQLKLAGSTEVDKFISAFDDESKAKELVITERGQEIDRLKADLRRLRSIEQSSEAGLLKHGSEADLYDGEVRDIVLAALKDALDRVAQPGSRRDHVLRDLLEANELGGEAEKMREELKGLLRDYRSMDGKTKTALTRLGFDLSDDGKHWKAIFQGDPRYTFAFPKTGSDHRGGLNMVSDINSKLF
ncbi:hypothetical protein ACG02S_01005 [Roseateles sp. DC23W]|uniref:Uncharacterized protein n=1 Tax=Pelomonas dachongensis TaxID=3299029 RepID=A0ABW7EG83_9BURK